MTTFKIPRITDQRIAEVFQGVMAPYGNVDVTVITIGGGVIGGVNLSQEPAGLWKQVLDYKSALIETVSTVIDGVQLRYFRGGTAQVKSLAYDEISVHQDNGQDNVSVKIYVVSEIYRQLNPIDSRSDGVAAVENDALTDRLALHESTVLRLEELSESLIQKTPNSACSSKRSLVKKIIDSKRFSNRSSCNCRKNLRKNLR